MANHGAVAYGADVAGALRATELLEWACTRVLARFGDRRAAGADGGGPRGGRGLRDADAVRVDAGGLGPMKAIAMGVHVLDVLVRPVEAIPEGQGGQLVEEIRMTAAGSAGGFALVLAKLGADVSSAGAWGPTPPATCSCALLERDGVDTSLLLRRDDVQTSASVLPIRPDGSRPAFHVVGANGTYGPDDAPWDAIEARRRTCTSAGRSSWAARRRRRSCRSRASTA